jgi:hypothetical protein
MEQQFSTLLVGYHEAKHIFCRNIYNAFTFRIKISVLQNRIFLVILKVWVKHNTYMTVKKGTFIVASKVETQTILSVNSVYIDSEFGCVCWEVMFLFPGWAQPS